MLSRRAPGAANPPAAALPTFAPGSPIAAPSPGRPPARLDAMMMEPPCDSCGESLSWISDCGKLNVGNRGRMDDSSDSAALTMSDPLSAPPQPADNSSLPAVLDPLVSSRAPSLSPPSPPSSCALAARAPVVAKAALAHARTPCACARARVCVPVSVCPCWCLPGRAPAPT